LIEKLKTGRKQQELERKIEKLRVDFADANGERFEHFYCPILLKDEAVPLCQAHLVNKAFSGASNRWTVQRADVDNFFGSFFEADFVELRHSDAPVQTALANGYSGILKPRITYKKQKVDFYRPRGKVPPQHSQILIGEQKGVKLALKIHPNALASTAEQDWEISLESDLRLAALVSVLKSAHLTLFDMLGYQYALSAGGAFLGHTILGSFFTANCNTPKRQVLVNAQAHFTEFANLVRPILTPESVKMDSIRDGAMCLCEGSVRWGFLLFIHTGTMINAVIAPTLETPDAAARFIEFLKEDGSRFQARRCNFDGESFKAAPNTETVYWPPAKFG
jgi:hypothetical protein